MIERKNIITAEIKKIYEDNINIYRFFKRFLKGPLVKSINFRDDLIGNRCG